MNKVKAYTGRSRHVKNHNYLSNIPFNGVFGTSAVTIRHLKRNQARECVLLFWHQVSPEVLFRNTVGAFLSHTT
jgi:hypothetical protein